MFVPLLNACWAPPSAATPPPGARLTPAHPQSLACLLLLPQGISHARLPIGGFIQLASSPVMTTNHVVDIMLRWLELR